MGLRSLHNLSTLIMLYVITRRVLQALQDVPFIGLIAVWRDFHVRGTTFTAYMSVCFVNTGAISLLLAVLRRLIFIARPLKRLVLAGKVAQKIGFDENKPFSIAEAKRQAVIKRLFPVRGKIIPVLMVSVRGTRLTGFPFKLSSVGFPLLSFAVLVGKVAIFGLFP